MDDFQLGTFHDKGDLVDRVNSSRHAASAQGPRDSLLNTWCKILEQWHGERVPVVPVQPEDIIIVGAVMRDKGYRSFPNYVSRVKEMHIRAGFDWTQRHALEAAQISRAVIRGAGPPRQSAELPLSMVVSLLPGIGDYPLNPGRPLQPGHTFLLGSLFMLRELELACARTSHVHLNIDEKILVWNVPTSKTDTMGLGAKLQWGCLCDTGTPSVPCPVHLMASHLDFLYHAFKLEAKDMPLFPDARGKVCAKQSIVDAVTELATLAKLPIMDQLGRPSYGGHSMRISGARWLAMLGVEIRKIQVLARWDSDVVLHYIKTASMASITNDCKALLQPGGSSGPAAAGQRCSRLPGTPVVLPAPSKDAASKKRLGELAGRAMLIEDSHSVLLSELEQLKANLTDLQHFVLDPVIINTRSNVAHSAAKAAGCFSRRTKCGWEFVDSTHRRQSNLPDDHPPALVCERCFPGLRAGTDGAAEG